MSMNLAPSFEAANAAAPSSSLNFDFNLQPNSSQIVYHHLSNIQKHIHQLSRVASTAHPLSAEQPPPEENINSDLLALTAAIGTYHATLRPVIEPLDGEPVVLGAERFVARIKEHSALLAKLGTRKQAIRQVMEQLSKVNVRKGGPRRDARFSERRIEAFAKDSGLLVYADDENNSSKETKRMTLGGKLVVVDIDFVIPSETGAVAPISKISVGIAPSDDESIASLGPAAAEVLTTNINEGDGESFYKNIKNLAIWDSCSEPPNQGLNCFASLKSVEDALELIHGQERKNATDEEVIMNGWGRPQRNIRNVIGLQIAYFRDDTGDYTGLVSVETRRRHFVHPPLQATYLQPDDPFITEEDLEMFPIPGSKSPFLSETPNWLEQNPNQDMNLIPGPNASFILELTPSVIVSVEAAQKICGVVGLGGWNDMLSLIPKDEWVAEDTTLEELLFGVMPQSLTVTVPLPDEERQHRYDYVPSQPIAARRVEKIPFSHPKQIFPILRILRQWAKFDSILKSIFSLKNQSSSSQNQNGEINLDDLLSGSIRAAVPFTITLTSSPSILLIFPSSSGRQTLQISILENGELDFNVIDELKAPLAKLFEGAGLGVCIEYLRKCSQSGDLESM